MSVSFRKPTKRIVRRKQNVGEDDDDQEPAESMNNNSVPTSSATLSESAPVIKEILIKFEDETPQSSSAPKAVSNLSFGDDEGDTVEFRTKKSSRSRRLAAQLTGKGKEKKPETHATNLAEKYGSQVDHSIPASGQQGNSSEEPVITVEDDEDDIQSTLFRRPPFATGKIPDALTVQEARKRREALRKAQEDEEFIPLDDTVRIEGGKSRLIREDENDVSDEDDEMVMTRQNTIGKSAKQREEERLQKTREAFELDEMIGGDLEESDDELKRWEDTQIRKGVSIPQIQSLSEELNRPMNYQPYGYEIYNEPIVQQQSAAVPQGAPSTRMSTVDDIRKKIKNRLDLAEDLQGQHESQAKTMRNDVKSSEEAIEKLELELKTASFEYSFYQEMRGYVMDVIDCFNEKLPVIVTREKQLLESWRKSAAVVRELRSQHVKDRDEEIHCKHNVLDSLHMAEEATARRHRLRQYQEHVSALARSRGQASVEMEELDGWNAKESEEIVFSLSNLFEDTSPEFCTLAGILSRFQRWQQECSESYGYAYIALCLPKLLSPLVRFETIAWNPLQKGAKALDGMKWFEELVCGAFGQSENQVGSIGADNPNLSVPSMLVEDVIISRLTELLSVWDPFSTLQTTRLASVLRRIFHLFPLSPEPRKPVQEFLRALAEKIRSTIDEEVFLPVYPQRILEADADAVAFADKQFELAVKLFGNLLMFHGILSNAVLVKLAIQRFLDLNILNVIRTSRNQIDMVDRCAALTGLIPDDNLNVNGSLAPTLEDHFRPFCFAMQNLGKALSNVEKMGSLRDSLAKLKDFKGAEAIQKQILDTKP